MTATQKRHEHTILNCNVGSKMNITIKLRNYLITSLCLLVIGCQHNPTNDTDIVSDKSDQLIVTTWNVEHLAFPISEGCKPRSPDDLEKLQNYAASLNSDIVALQEVGSAKAAHLLFPKEQWNVYISDRPDSEPYECRRSGFKSTQQKVAYAVRKDLDVKSVNTLAEFGLDEPGLRHGLELVVDTEIGTTTILNVHMKSGCFVDDHTRSDSEACLLFSRQVPILDKWVEDKERKGRPYPMVGDFNHRLSAPYNRLTRTLANNSDNSDSNLYNRTRDLIGCHPYYPALIDHIFAGHILDAKYNFKTSTKAFENMEPREMLSDHCAVILEIER